MSQIIRTHKTKSGDFIHIQDLTLLLYGDRERWDSTEVKEYITLLIESLTTMERVK